MCTLNWKMASQIATTGELHVIEFQSYVSGYHVYMESWNFTSHGMAADWV